MFEDNPNLKYRELWLLIGYALILFVIYSSLTSSPITVDVNYFDKYAHTLGYFVLMGWFMQIYHVKKSVYICGAFFIMMGVSLEFIQGLTGYRYFDVYDMFANTAGVFLALILIKTPFPKMLNFIESKMLALV